MKGYGHGEPAPICIHYQRFAFPRVPRRKHLLASHNLPPLPLSLSLFLSSLHHRSFSALDPQESPRKQVFSVKQPAERGETQRQRELTRRPNRARAWEGEGEGLALGPPPAGVTLHPAWPRCLIPSLLIYHVWTYSCSSGFRLKTNCWSGGFVKEMSVLSAEGLKLI